jgi:uncharacterized metal-binding protein YceD (DUF177 family)
VAPENHKHYINAKVLRINVGYILSQGIGFSRETEIEVPSLFRVAQDLMLGHFYATLRLSHLHGGILVQGRVETSVMMECSRCIDEIWLPVEFEVQELFASSTANLNTEYKIGDDYVIDLAPLIREESLLHIPMTTPVDTEGRCLFCERTFHDILREHGLVDDIDPRLEILRTLRDRLNNSDE